MYNSYRIKELKAEVNREYSLNCLHCSSNGTPNAPEKLNPNKITQLIREGKGKRDKRD